MPENPINAENFGLDGLPDKLSGEWTEESVDINAMIMDAAVRFGHASKAERISIAIQCGALATEATAESAVCPAELITLWGSALRDIEVEVRQAAVFGLYLSTPPEAHKFASEIRRVAVDIDTPPQRQNEAWIVLARIGERDGICWLAKQLRHDEKATREAAAKELQKVDGKQLVTCCDIRHALNDDSEIVQVAGARLLWEGENNTSETVPVLLKMVANKTSQQRLEAAGLLCRMGHAAHSALPDLIALREEDDWTLRLQAVRAIRMIGRNVHDSIDVLTSLSNDPNQFVAREAREVLTRAMDE